MPKSPSILASFRFAWQGVKHAFRTQRNFRVHAAVTALVVLAGLMFRLSWTEWAVIALTVAVVFQAELVNTALEAVVDHVSPDFHALAKVAKDCAAAAVLVVALGAVAVGVAIFLPRLLGG
ncbi:MAG: diacylglycerol kinase family protein [Thermoflexales bacterium]|nr:diacylglycerol kinase family protein [Thermoflexales bacterium]